MRQSLFNMKILYAFIISLIISFSVCAQEYIVFEEQKGAHNSKPLQGLNMSLNHVELAAGDTCLSLYNWYLSPKAGFNWKLLSPQLSILSQKLLNNLVIVAVPLTNTKENYKKLSYKQLQQLKIISNDTLIKRLLVDLNKHMQPRTALMPALKTLKYGLIVKRGKVHYLVQNPVLVTQFIVSHERTYFPNEYRNGTLAINPNNATYSFETIDKLDKELRKKELPRKWLEKIVNRIYLSKIDVHHQFNRPVFSFWEYPNDDVVSSLFPLKELHEFNLGLGSFQYVDGIGIINATLDTFLKHQISFQQTPYFNIKQINGLNLADYISALQKQKD